MAPLEYVHWIDTHSFMEWKNMVQHTTLDLYIKALDANAGKDYSKEYTQIKLLINES